MRKRKQSEDLEGMELEEEEETFRSPSNTLPAEDMDEDDILGESISSRTRAKSPLMSPAGKSKSDTSRFDVFTKETMRAIPNWAKETEMADKTSKKKKK